MPCRLLYLFSDRIYNAHPPEGVEASFSLELAFPHQLGQESRQVMAFEMLPKLFATYFLSIILDYLQDPLLVLFGTLCNNQTSMVGSIQTGKVHVEPLQKDANKNDAARF